MSMRILRGNPLQVVPRSLAMPLVLLAILASFLCAALPVYALPSQVRISGTNRNLFAKLSNGSTPYACYISPDDGGLLGRLNRSSVTTATLWRYQTAATLNRQIASTRSLITKLRRQKKTATRAYTQAQSTLRSLNKSLATFTLLKSRCRLSTEFSGNPISIGAYHEKLTPSEVTHLLNKIAFGGSPDLYQLGVAQGLTPLVNALVDGRATQAQENDLQSKALFWASQAFYYYQDDPEYANIRIWTTEAAQIGQMYRFIYSKNPFHEFMFLLLAGHFATNLDNIDFSYSRFYHTGIKEHWELLRTNAVGNLKSLALALYNDPAMNYWLDNKDNSAGEPNQNFARELLELFLLGAIDPITGQANYGEDTIQAATGFASGYTESSKTDPETGELIIKIRYDPDRHSTEPFTLFSETSAARIMGALSPSDLVNRTMTMHPGSPRYLAERIAGQLLYPGLPETMVQPLATALKSGNFELKPFLKTILKSEAMFSSDARGACVESPLESEVKLARRVLTLPLSAAGDDLQKNFYMLVNLANTAEDSGQGLFKPPSVFGYKGACNINRAGQIAHGEGYLTAQRVLNRSTQCASLMNHLAWLEYDLPAALGVSNPITAQSLVQTVASKVFDLTLTSSQLEVLSRFLVTGHGESSDPYQMQVDLTDDYFVRMKLMRLICLLSDFIETNVR